jgi:hypothetical protein
LPPIVVPGRRLEGVGGGGAGVGREDSVVPAGPRGWERRAPIFVRFGIGIVVVVCLCDGLFAESVGWFKCRMVQVVVEVEGSMLMLMVELELRPRMTSSVRCNISMLMYCISI